MPPMRFSLISVKSHTSMCSCDSPGSIAESSKLVQNSGLSDWATGRLRVVLIWWLAVPLYTLRKGAGGLPSSRALRLVAQYTCTRTWSGFRVGLRVGLRGGMSQRRRTLVICSRKSALSLGGGSSLSFSTAPSSSRTRTCRSGEMGRDHARCKDARPPRDRAKFGAGRARSGEVMRDRAPSS